MRRFIYLIVSSASLFFLLLFPTSTSVNASWELQKSLPYQNASQVGFNYENFLYTIGGSVSTGFSRGDILYIDSNNTSTDNWINVFDFPLELIFHTVAKSDNYIYILGGKEENPGSTLNHVDNVYFANIENNFPVWSPQPNLPVESSVGGASVVITSLYYAGGFNNNGFINNVYKSNINNDGTISTWENAGTLPEAMYGFGMINVDNTFIIIGGKSSNGYINKTYKAVLDNSGNITSWQELSSLPKGITRAGYIRSGNTIFVIGGETSNGITNEIYYAEITNNNELSEWKRSESSFPRSNCCSAVVENNGSIFVIGGHDGSSYFDTVHKALASSLKSSTLNVPLVQQTQLPWRNDIYDNALIWSPQKPSISNWGCAITSAVMVLQYYGLNKMPDGTELNPGSLNTWLINNNGYVNGGHTNWAGIAALSKKMKDSGHNPSFQYSALEVQKINPNDITTIKDNIKSNYPIIVGTTITDGKHFVVANGFEENTITIKDPGFNKSNLTEYNNIIESLTKFSPSNTDLSYFVTSTPNNMSISLYDSESTLISSSIIQDPIESPLEEGLLSGSPISLLEYPKPDSGEYFLSLKSFSNSFYDTALLIYHKNGEEIVKKIEGYVSSTNPELLKINFDKENKNNIEIIEEITLNKIINDINIAVTLKDINSAIGRSLTNHLSGAEKDITKNNNRSAQAKVKAAKTIIQNTRNTSLISTRAKSILLEEINLYLEKTF